MLLLLVALIIISALKQHLQNGLPLIEDKNYPIRIDPSTTVNGGGLMTNQGIFTAPVEGAYLHFTFTTLANNVTTTLVNLVKNGHQVIASTRGTFKYSTLSMAKIIELKKGDTVSTNLIQGSLYDDDFNYFTHYFTGVRIHSAMAASFSSKSLTTGVVANGDEELILATIQVSGTYRLTFSAVAAEKKTFAQLILNRNKTIDGGRYDAGGDMYPSQLIDTLWTSRKAVPSQCALPADRCYSLITTTQNNSTISMPI